MIYLQLLVLLNIASSIFSRPVVDETLLATLQEEFPAIDMSERRERLIKLGGSIRGSSKPLGDKPFSAMINPPMSDSDFPGIVGTNQESGISDYLFQGDIHLTEKQLRNMEDLNANPIGTRTRRHVALDADKWPNGIVYYYIDDSLARYMIDLIEIAIRYYEDNTCIRFKKSKTATNRIRFFNGTGCYSMIGMFGGEQNLSLGTGCNTVATVYHELLHALGYTHTQSRYDRDQYLIVDLSRVPPNRTNNFYKFGKDEMKIFTPFEYGSVMEYPSDAFTIDGSYSLIPRDKRYLYTMGGDITTYYDTIMVNKYYCSDSSKKSGCAFCQNGGECNPNDCTKCICPLGYSGALCNQRPSGCGSELTATENWQSITITIGNIGTLANIFSFCNYFIRAPADKSPQARITFMPDGPRRSCYLGCIANGIEFKTEDVKMTNIRYCCKNDTATYETRTSKLNPMPVIVYNRRDDFPVTFEYRYV